MGLLGDVAAVLAVNVRAATTDDAGLAAASYELLAMFSTLFGIPLSFLALATGVLLGLSLDPPLRSRVLSGGRRRMTS